MSRILALLGCALLASCGGDPSGEALRSFLRGDADVPADGVALDTLNQTFASEAVRSGAVARELKDPGALYSPIVRGDDAAPVDVRIWRDRGVIDAGGRFAPTSPGRELGSAPAVEGLQPRDAAERAARLAGALLLVAPELRQLEWSEAGELAVRLSAAGTTATANPRLLLLLAPIDPLAEPGDPSVPQSPLAAAPDGQPSGPEAGFHTDIKTGNDCLDTLFLVALAPAWIAWHIGDLCGFGVCSTGGVAPAAPSLFLPLALLPALLAMRLSRRRR